jgi:hypothetical protein
MGTEERFTAADLHRIVVEFMRGMDDTFTAFPAGEAVGPVLYCVWCHRPNTAHAPSCEGEARRALAVKARRMQRETVS